MICALLGLVGGFIGGMAFDPGRDLLILVAFAFLLVAVARATAASGALAGAAFATAYFGLVFRWLSSYGWLPLAALVAVIFVPVWAVIGGLTAGLARGRAAQAVLFGAGFLITEQVLRQMGYSGVPWAHPAHALAAGLSPADGMLTGGAPSLLVARLSPIFGANGVGAMIVASNAGVALALLSEGWKRWLGIAVAATVCLTVLLPSAVSPLPSEMPGGVQVAAVQTATPTTMEWTPEVKTAVLTQYQEQVKKAQEEGARFIILPESFLQEIDFPGSELQRWIARDWLKRGSVIFYGAGFIKESADYPERVYPALVIVDSRGFRGAILKHQLVPLGEFVLWRKFLTSWLSWYPWSPYDSRATGSIGPVRIKGYEVGGLICYETLYPELARRLSLAGADFLVSATNSSWFGHTRATEQMVRFESYRALETGKYFVRAGTAGISSLIAPDGQIKKALPQFVNGFILGTVTPTKRLTFYVRHGDFVPWLVCSLVVLGIFGVWLGNGGRGPADA